jgi:hypothetical protein
MADGLHRREVRGVIPLGSVGSGWTIEGVGNFDDSNGAQIRWRHSYWLVYVWYLNSAGVLTNVVGLGALDANPRMAGIGDLNDGFQDIVWIREPTGSAYEWLMRATQGTYTTAPIGQASGWTIA